MPSRIANPYTRPRRDYKSRRTGEGSASRDHYVIADCKSLYSSAAGLLRFACPSGSRSVASTSWLQIPPNWGEVRGRPADPIMPLWITNPAELGMYHNCECWPSYKSNFGPRRGPTSLTPTQCPHDDVGPLRGPILEYAIHPTSHTSSTSATWGSIQFDPRRGACWSSTSLFVTLFFGLLLCQVRRKRNRNCECWSKTSATPERGRTMLTPRRAGRRLARRGVKL